MAMIEMAAPPADPNAGRVIKFTNITDKDFTHAFGGQPFFIKAGETVMFPYHLAKHLAKHLSRKIFLDTDKSPSSFDPTDKTGGAGRPLWDEAKERSMMEKILGESFTEETAMPKSEMELLKQQVADLQKRFPTAEATVVTPSQDAVEAPQVDVKESVGDIGYKDKAEIMADLDKLGIKYEVRWTKAKLAALLPN